MNKLKSIKKMIEIKKKKPLTIAFKVSEQVHKQIISIALKNEATSSELMRYATNLLIKQNS